MEIVNNELKKLSSWFQANKLSINIKKNQILFYLKQNKTGKDLTNMKFCSWDLYLMNTYLGNFKYRTQQEKSQNQ